MQKLYYLAPFLVLFLAAGCSNNKEPEPVNPQKKQADSIAHVQINHEMEKLRTERRKILDKGDTFTADFGDDPKECKIFLFTKVGESIPLKLQGNKITGIDAEHGKIYDVQKDNGKIILISGGDKKEKELQNTKIYMTDSDGFIYNVKIDNGRLLLILKNGKESELVKK